MDATRAVKSKFGGCEIRLDFVSNPEFQSEDKDAEDDVVKAREDVRRCRRLLSKARDVHRSPREDEHPRWRRHAIVARLRITLWIMCDASEREEKIKKKCRDVRARCDYNHHHIVLLASSVSSGRKCFTYTFLVFCWCPAVVVVVVTATATQSPASFVESA